jgi:hypothetical protein
MKIVNSNVQMSMQHNYLEKNTQQTVVQTTTPTKANTQTKTIESPDVLNSDLDIKSNPKYHLLKLLYRSLTGKEMNHLEAKEFMNKIQGGEQELHLSVSFASQTIAKQASFQFIESHYEKEKLHVSLSGNLQTADGKKFEIEYDMIMQRSFAESRQLTIGNLPQELKDPLIINFNRSSSGLSTEKNQFDIDADGIIDSVATTLNGSGFLAVDKDLNGKIDNGTEVFGAITGNGFKELSGFDDDHNGFIDEGDAIFSHLKILQKLDGESLGINLKQANIGAISLQSIKSPFTIKDENNVEIAVVKATGYALSEDGDVKTVQQLDLFV